eukprot:PRCOL_00002439-RA
MAAAAAATACRGALVVLEGGDRCGKTTQSARLVDALNARGMRAELWRFPDRTTAMGQMIDSYLRSDSELDDRAVHLLFSANRWEKLAQMREALGSGTTLVVDRYAYSGAAFTGGKGIDLGWCKAPDAGLPRPDAVLFLELGLDEAEARGGYGEERYEKRDFQEKVLAQFRALREPWWQVIDAARTPDEVYADIEAAADKAIAAAKQAGGVDDMPPVW